MALYGEELRQSIIRDREALVSAIADRSRMISEGLTDIDDCFMSQRCEERGIGECDMKLAILDRGGVDEYDTVFDETGNEVSWRWVNTRYGLKVVARGIFANSIKALCKKTGWHEGKVVAPTWVKFVSSGRGLLGVYSGSYIEVRWPVNMATGEYVGYPND